MDKQGFSDFLVGRKQTPQQIEESINLVEQFLDYRQAKPEETPSILIWDFSSQLIRDGKNTYANYLALARYFLFTKDDALFVPVLELLDGEESMDNLSKKLGELYDEAIQAEIFQDHGLPPLGTPTKDKPKYTAAVINRLTARFGEEGCKDLIKDSLRTLPDEMHAEAKALYERCDSFDQFLDEEETRFLNYMTQLNEEKKLYFAQEITDEVLDFLKAHPEITHGEREGNILYETKIPFLTPQYLAETDPIKKKYYYCHCPWARESLIRENGNVPGIFCNCSAGFHKKKYEVIFGQPLKAEVVESVLMGDERCRFAIYLPEGIN